MARSKPCIILLISLLVISCRPVVAVKMMHAKNASQETWKVGEKTVVFIPMVHVGTPEFYADVANTISVLKKQGYVLYYEGVKKDPGQDSASFLNYMRKFRKMTGLVIDSIGYAALFHEKGLFKSKIDQPKASNLGADENDRQVDVHFFELVDAYEKKHGAIWLTAADSTLSLTSAVKYPPAMKLPSGKVMDILVNHRDKHLADYILSSPHKKVVVIYGYAHKKGTYKLLRNQK